MSSTKHFVVHGSDPIFQPMEGTLGKVLFESLLNNSVCDSAMIDYHTNKVLSYAALLEDSCNLATALRNYGCTPDTKVFICSENHINYFTVVLASLYIGATIAPVNHLHGVDDLRTSLEISAPRIAFCTLAVADKLLSQKKEMNFLETVIIIDDDGDHLGAESLKNFITRQLCGSTVFPETFKPYNECDPCEHVAVILCSSGTTGFPKGVMLTDRNFLVRHAQTRETKYSWPGCFLGVLPFYHTFGFTMGIISILDKNKIIIQKRFEEDSYLKAVQDYKIRVLSMTPPTVVFLSKTPKIHNYDLSSLEEIVCGGAPLNKLTEDLLKKRFKNLIVTHIYGMTETTFLVTQSEKEVVNKVNKSGSVGKVVCFMSLKVIDPVTGQSLGPNSVGEILVKGPTVMKGYYKNPESTKEAFILDGWLKTGDLGYYDDDQCFFVVDRLKELIKYNGYQVAPAELEAILINHPKILEAGVVGTPDEIAGELPTAYVVKREGTDITEEEIIDYVAVMVAPQKRLRGGVVFAKVVPKNASGKIMRTEIRKILAELRRGPMISS